MEPANDILPVEDEKDSREPGKQTLEMKTGAEVDAAERANPEAASRYPVVVSDYRLGFWAGEYDGLEFLEELQGYGFDGEFILFSTPSPSTEFRRRLVILFMMAGVVRTLKKGKATLKRL